VATAADQLVFGDVDRFRGKIEDLAAHHTDFRSPGESFAASSAGQRFVADNFVGVGDLPQGVTFVAVLPAGFAPGFGPQ
jgi:hypothetical protein